jgi:N-acetylglucosaminyldiphosphoundecaprenol N-acetyl-beta-D-mannosaminyltransferase
MKKIRLKNIDFLDIEKRDFKQIIKNDGLFVFPSGPGLSTIEKEKSYLRALENSDYVFFDSGYFVLLLRLLKKINVKKFSGYLFFKLLIKHLEKNKNKKILSIDPNLELSKQNQKFFTNVGIRNDRLFNYISPIYNPTKLLDKKLLMLAKKIKPDYIILNLGGGVQEVLGYYLKKNTNFKTKIICTGAAISFFTGDQAPINKTLDKFFLGWLTRILFKPYIYIPRYFKAFKLLHIVLNERIKTQNI